MNFGIKKYFYKYISEKGYILQQVRHVIKRETVNIHLLIRGNFHDYYDIK